jgi:hypothetical protein
VAHPLESSQSNIPGYLHFLVQTVYFVVIPVLPLILVRQFSEIMTVWDDLAKKAAIPQAIEFLHYTTCANVL